MSHDGVGTTGTVLRLDLQGSPLPCAAKSGNTKGIPFLMELVHRDGLMRHYAPHAISHSPDGLMVLEERTFDLLTSRNEVVMTMLTSEGQRAEYRHSLRIYTLTELVSLVFTCRQPWTGKTIIPTRMLEGKMVLSPTSIYNHQYDIDRLVLMRYAITSVIVLAGQIWPGLRKSYLPP